MPPDIQITVEHGVIRVVYGGLVEYDVVTELLRQVGQIALETLSERLLFDIRTADYTRYYLGTIRHAEEGPALGIDRRFRIAFLGSKGNQMLKYIEDVAVNRGYQVKAFVVEQEAIVWLQGSP
jgi:hypothetical protein